MARALVAGGIALFFLVQTLAFVFSPNGRIAFSNGDAGASIAMAGEVSTPVQMAAARLPRRITSIIGTALCARPIIVT